MNFFKGKRESDSGKRGITAREGSTAMGEGLTHSLWEDVAERGRGAGDKNRPEGR